MSGRNPRLPSPELRGGVSGGVGSAGRRAISDSADGTLKVWDLETGTALITFVGDSEFESCDVAPDDRTLVAGDYSGRVHILRIEEPG